MKIRYIKSACVAVESKGVKILTDPWLIDGEYYGSWHHYPPLEFDKEYFDDVDYIYVSHIHPDHFSKKSFELLRKDIPVLIHQYAMPFLKKNIEMLGFKVTELPHAQKIELKNGVSINILAADNCNPELCAKFMGCGILETKFKSTQIDSLCVIDDGEFRLMNTNDCPYGLAKEAVAAAKERYETIDFLLVGYAGAGPYPQCFELDEEERRRAENGKKMQFLNQAENYLELVKPRYFMPFAGTYTLGGKLSSLHQLRGVPELEEAGEYFSQSERVRQLDSKLVLLNTYEYFDLQQEKPSREYEPIDLEDKQEYIEEVLSKKLLDYETDEQPKSQEIWELIPSAYERMEKKRKSINFSTQTKVLLDLSDGSFAKVNMDGSGFEKVQDYEHLDSYIIYKLDPKLLKRILKGPRYAHWNNAEIGSHIRYTRKPNSFERALHHSMNFFHA